MTPKHTTVLLSGVEAEYTEFTGLQQRLLSQKSNAMSKNLDEVVKSILIRVGDINVIDDAFVNEMLVGDKKKLLVDARQASLDFEPTFKFDYEYENAENKLVPHPLEINIEEGFDTKKYKQQVTNYSELKKLCMVDLPRSGLTVSYSLLDGKGEAIGYKIPKNKINTHTPIIMRNPKVVSEKGIAVSAPYILDLDRLPLKDIEALRTDIYENEGDIDTTISFEHPLPKMGDANIVKVDVLNVISFFYPSGKI
jgi:hypothetical protein